MKTERRPSDRIKVAVTESPIGYPDAREVAASSDGAVVTFAGVVRDSSEGRSVVGLDYEAYSQMAENEMHRIAEEACERWDIGSVSILHRVGSLDVGEVSVLVTVSAPHRGEAFDACEFCIDRLKQTVPIWKRELFADGSSAWVDHP